jgi:hypothetical protein
MTRPWRRGSDVGDHLHAESSGGDFDDEWDTIKLPLGA